MAYDPTLTSFIVVAVVGGVAAVMNISADWELEHELSRATERWTRLAVARGYPPTAEPERASREAAILEEHGYVAVADDGGGPGTPVVEPGTTICYRRSRTA